MTVAEVDDAALAAAAITRAAGGLPPPTHGTRNDVEAMCAALVSARDAGDLKAADALTKPWDILPDEGWAEYRAFQQWLSLPKRTFREVAIASGNTEAAISKLASKYAWRRRAEAHDWWWTQAADTMRKAALAETVKQSITQIAQLPSVIADGLSVARSKLQATLAEIEQAEQAGEPHPVSLNQLARLVDSMRGLSAELRNWTQATPTFSLNVNATTNVGAVSLLSADELSELVRGLVDANLIDAATVDAEIVEEGDEP